MGRLVERLDRGLVTVRDAALLQPGELSDLRNAYYRPAAQALNRAKGRSQFGLVTANGTTGLNVVGLRDAKFDNGDHYLLAHASANYFRAPVGDTGAFTSFYSSATGASLETAHWNNLVFLLNGVNTNQVFYLSATAAGTTPSVRRHGLLPVTATPASATSAGTWSQSTTGYFEYWTTEIASTTKDGAKYEIESTFTGDPATVFVSATGVSVTVGVPARVNSGSYGWKVYRSPAKTNSTDKQFPSGFFIGQGVFAEVTGTNTSLVDGSLTTGSYQFATATATAGAGELVWTSSGNAFSDNNLYMTADTTERVSRFSFGDYTVIDPIQGLEVSFGAFRSSSSFLARLQIAVSNDGGSSFSNYKTASVTGTSEGDYVLGGNRELWGLGWTALGVTSANFRVKVRGYMLTGGTLSVDYVRARFYYSGTNPSAVAAFPAVIIESSELTAGVGRDGEPPVSSTGDMFEGAMVVNNTLIPGRIHWSAPLLPESFPSVYYDDIDTKENDRTTHIKTLNNRLIVGLTSSLHRMNYLPNESDANFSRGRARELISNQFGIANEMCACVVSMEGGKQVLVFANDKGVFSTDAFGISSWSDDLDWRTTVLALANSSVICLINDPENWSVWLYYRQDALGADSYRKLQFCYHPSHLKDGKPKIGGPVYVRNTAGASTAELYAAWSVRRSSGDTSIYQGYGGATAAGGGFVYLDTGSTLPVSDATMGYQTRRMYLADFGGEWKLTQTHGYFSSYTGSPELTHTVKNVKTDDPAGEVSGATKTKTLTGQKLARLHLGQMCEGARISMSASGSVDQAHEFLILDGEGFGAEDSGK